MGIVSIKDVCITYSVNFTVDRDQVALILKRGKKKFKNHVHQPSWYVELLAMTQWKRCAIVEFPLCFRHHSIGSFLRFLKESQYSQLMDLEETIRLQIPFAIS